MSWPNIRDTDYRPSQMFFSPVQTTGELCVKRSQSMSKSLVTYWCVLCKFNSVPYWSIEARPVPRKNRPPTPMLICKVPKKRGPSVFSLERRGPFLNLRLFFLLLLPGKPRVSLSSTPNEQANLPCVMSRGFVGVMVGTLVCFSL